MAGRTQRHARTRPGPCPAPSAATLIRPPSRICRNCRKPCAARAQQVLLGHPAAPEHQLPRVRRRASPSSSAVATGRSRRCRSRRRCSTPRRSPVRAVIVDELRQRRAGVGDEHLGAVDHPLAAVEPRGGSGRTGVGARARLRQPERAQAAPEARSWSQRAPAARRAEQVDRHRAQRRVRGHGDREGAVDPRQLLDRDRVGDRVETGAARTPRATGCRAAPAPPPAAPARPETGPRGRAPLRPAPAAPPRRPARSRGAALLVGAGRSSVIRRAPPPARRAAARRSRCRPCRRSRRGSGAGRPCRRCRGAPRGRRRRTPAGSGRRRGIAIRMVEAFAMSANVRAEHAFVASRAAAAARCVAGRSPAVAHLRSIHSWSRPIRPAW